METVQSITTMSDEELAVAQRNIGRGILTHVVLPKVALYTAIYFAARYARRVAERTAS